MSNIKYDWNDITIVPAELSDISSRKEINPFRGDGMLPLFTAPMDTVISEDNADLFYKNKINICLPRGIKPDITDGHYFHSYGLDEIISIVDSNCPLPKKVLIDVANGHMKKLYDTAKKIKETYGDKVELMIGNVANPETYVRYCEIGVDWVRVGIGGGSACTTSANVAVHYPMASLVRECYLAGSNYENVDTRLLDYRNRSKIVADGGFRNFSDIIKAIGLGADAVMIGGILNKSLESISDCYTKVGDQFITITNEDALNRFNLGEDVYKYYRGMSTKEVQKSWNKAELKTGEGISKYNKVEYTIESWVENFTDYLKSNMSYCGKKELKQFVGNANYVRITDNAFKRFNK